MHSLNKYLVLNVIMILGIMRPMHAGLAAATDSASAAQSASLAQATAQPQAQPGTLAQAVEQAKPSTVVLAIVRDKETGITFNMVTEFTPKEIDKYPGFERAFAEHAATHLESENHSDIAAISYLIEKHPEFVVGLDRVANKGGSINNTIRKRLNKANRKPVMSLQYAATVAGSVAANGFVMMGQQVLSVEDARRKALDTAKIAFVDNILDGQGVKRALEAIANKEVSFADDVSKQQNGHLKQFVEELPRTMTIAVGTAALSSVALREFDERIGDPFPTPKYDPKSYNVSRYSHIAAKWALRHVVVPFVLGKYVVTPIVDTTTSIVHEATREPIIGTLSANQIDVLSNADTSLFGIDDCIR